MNNRPLKGLFLLAWNNYDATRHIKQCKRCLRFKALPKKAHRCDLPMELVHMDYLTMEANEGGKDIHILVITNHFTQYAQASITSSQIAKCRT